MSDGGRPWLPADPEEIRRLLAERRRAVEAQGNRPAPAPLQPGRHRTPQGTLIIESAWPPGYAGGADVVPVPLQDREGKACWWCKHWHARIRTARRPGRDAACPCFECAGYGLSATGRLLFHAPYTGRPPGRPPKKPKDGGDTPS